MLPDFGWTELLVIAIVLIVIVGPKDLPKMLRTFGKATSSMRRMAGDFRKQFDEALKEAELDDVRSLARDVKGLDPRNEIKSALNPLGKVGEDLNEDLKRATRDFDKSDKPKSATESALASSGDKMRAAQRKAQKPAMPEQAQKPADKPRTAPTKPAPRKTAGTKAPAATKADVKSASAKANGGAKPAPAKTARAKTTAKAATSTGSASKAKTSGKRRPAAKPKAASAGEKT